MTTGLQNTSHTPAAERRRNARIAYRLQATRSGADGFFVEDEILNVSRSGLFLRTAELLKVGDRLELFIQIPGERHELAVQADVVHVRQAQTPGSDKLSVLAGLYLSFVEPSQKRMLRAFLESLLRDSAQSPAPVSKEQPRIRVNLEGAMSGAQLQHLQQISEKGLFIEVPYPLSIFEQPRIRLVNPLTQELCDFSGEIVHAQVMGTKSDNLRYGIGVRFGDFTPSDRQSMDKLLTSLSGSPRPRKVPTA